MTAARSRSKFAVVWVWALGRIARLVNHLLDVPHEMNRIGVESISFGKNIDSSGRLVDSSWSSSLLSNKTNTPQHPDNRQESSISTVKAQRAFHASTALHRIAARFSVGCLLLELSDNLIFILYC